MARLQPVPAEASGGSTPAAVNARFIQRDQDRVRHTKLLMDRADRWLKRFPEFLDGSGEPSTHAVYVLIGLRRELGRELRAGDRRRVYEAYVRYRQGLGDAA